ncbi:WD repeat-containing protein 37-like [Asterias rubens]|uniref:WD repeat-containing protein 37-like n=1 Tax=Asterias rubens TaxID=7604 RepID=UPI0014558EDC|nr:WD repeat-containing protein 37-like [Asterias rubens]XP_033624510.1 WD repeat-containing protein 37-like [Asterias rubens]
MPTDQGSVKKTTKQRLSIQRMRDNEAAGRQRGLDTGDSILPQAYHTRLFKLFGQIEHEFEGMYAENLQLQDKVEALTEKLEAFQSGKVPIVEGADGFDGPARLSVRSKASTQLSNLIMKPKYKPTTGKNVFSFKGASTSGCQQMRHFRGHRDGVWEVSVSRGDMPLLGTAGADRTARLWCIETGACVLEYVGHLGSVNSIRFHPTESLVLTSSGDSTAHIWKSTVTLPPLIHQVTDVSKSCPSSGDDVDGSDKEEPDVGVENENIVYVKSPQSQLEGHSGAIIAADWLAGGKQLVTASWDRTANLYDVDTRAIVHTLTGHDQQLTHCCAHPSQKLVVTSSADTTFRLWDFRDPSIHSVNVFQGHTDSVTSAAFASGDKIVSGSDDRSAKVWDLKNMRTPIAMIRSDSGINRLSVSLTNNVIAIPHDNRHIRLYDLNGVRLARMPRNNRMGHHRMVCCTAWNDESSSCNLFSCGFDRQVIGWKVGILAT